jgi:hypothetical protein
MEKVAKRLFKYSCMHIVQQNGAAIFANRYTLPIVLLPVDFYQKKQILKFFLALNIVIYVTIIVFNYGMPSPKITGVGSNHIFSPLRGSKQLKTNLMEEIIKLCLIIIILYMIDRMIKRLA